jgi:hypothetical protein
LGKAIASKYNLRVLALKERKIHRAVNMIKTLLYLQNISPGTGTGKQLPYPVTLYKTGRDKAAQPL